MKIIVNYFRKYPYALVMVLIMLIWASINTIEANKYSRLLASEGKYTIGIIKKIEGAKSGRWVTVEFLFDGKIYKSETKNERIPHSWIGEKVFVKFLPSRPVEFELYDTIEVTDSLGNLPPTVWDALPVR
jgi:hypothetical protein